MRHEAHEALAQLERHYGSIGDVDADASQILDATACLTVLAAVDVSTLDDASRVDLMKRTRALYAANRGLLERAHNELDRLRRAISDEEGCGSAAHEPPCR